MKELFCKILAAIFILLIIASLINMRQDLLTHNHALSNPDIFLLANHLNVFDMVLIDSKKNIGVIEEMTNNVYHVVFRDDLNHTIHGVYTKNQLQKVLIVMPQK